MSYFRLLVSCFFYLLFIGYGSCGVPVLVWESSAVTEKEDVIPALLQLDVDEFSNHLIKKVHVHKPLIVVFLEETLSVEDFSWKDTKHQGSFPQIKNITSMSAKIEFIPSVDDPVSSLKELILSHNYVWKKYDGKKLPTEPGVILLVKMKDPLSSDDRPDLLRRHDGNIADVYSQLLAKHSRIIALYTGKQSSWVEFESNRVRREAAEDSGIDYNFRNIRLHSSAPPVVSDKEFNATLSTTPEFAWDDRQGKGYVRLIASFSLPEEVKKITLRFKFPKEEDRWSLSDIEYGNEGRVVVLSPDHKISAKVGKSFETSSPVIFKNSSVPDVLISFPDLQLKAYSTQESSYQDQGPTFFTDAIWSGLIVAFVLGIILTWGILMLLDIKTMDRFDDPKGKTITVSATD